MNKLFVKLVNHWFYPVACSIGLAILLFVLRSEGYSLTEIAGLAVLVAVLILLWRLLLTRQTEEIDSVTAIRRAISNGERPTIIEFFSSYCVGCMAMKPVVARLEQEAGDRLQIIRLNIDQEPGKTLMDEFGVVFTPTFIYFDKQGNKLRDSIGVLDQARILYDLETP